ncbi:hypothetical protein ACTWP5_31310 [Streptomyces sp. 4N509B]|uniref:hypothetical protein n=1 Tax=Streptomyces sp. 4N509B TaxID=3457413 RepID=UPI003FD3C389
MSIPLSADDCGSATGALVTLSSAGTGEEEERRATLDAACWLMPSLSRDLIAYVLGLGPDPDGPCE